APEYFGAVEINHGAIIAHETKFQISKPIGRRDFECPAEIGCDEFCSGIGTKTDRGGFSVRPVAQARGTAGPRQVIECYADPVRSLIRASVGILPCRATRDERHGEDLWSCGWDCLRTAGQQAQNQSPRVENSARKSH